MPEDPNALTLALILTAAGVTPAAALVTGLVSLVKTLIPGDVTAQASRIAAFVLSAGLVVLAYVATAVEVSIATGFGAFLAWYAIARLAIATYDDVTSKPNSLTGPTA
jgi:hypothetical protein